MGSSTALSYGLNGICGLPIRPALSAHGVMIADACAGKPPPDLTRKQSLDPPRPPPRRARRSRRRLRSWNQIRCDAPDERAVRTSPSSPSGDGITRQPSSSPVCDRWQRCLAPILPVPGPHLARLPATPRGLLHTARHGPAQHNRRRLEAISATLPLVVVGFQRSRP